MNLGFSQHFPWGEPTYFRQKILLSETFPSDFSKPSPNFLLEDLSKAIFPKPHTIREDINERWRAEMLIHHVYNNRTKDRECFLVNKCISTQRIIIMYKAEVVKDSNGNEITGDIVPVVMIDGRRMNDNKIELLATNDGFDSVEKFFQWFSKDFNGKIIHWTKLRY